MSVVFLGAAINALEALLGAVFGLFFKQKVSKELSDFLLKGQGLCVILVAIQGMAGQGSVIIATISVALGSLIGYALAIDAKVTRLGKWAEAKLGGIGSKSNGEGSFAKAFVTSTLFTCTGAMAILGSLSAGIDLDSSTLLAKGLIDMVVCIPMAASMGIGVAFCSVSLLVYEGILSLLASFLTPILSTAVITEMVATGSLLLLAVGTNLLEITDIKVANMLPAAFLPIALVPLATVLGLM